MNPTLSPLHLKRMSTPSLSAALIALAAWQPCLSAETSRPASERSVAALAEPVALSASGKGKCIAPAGTKVRWMTPWKSVINPGFATVVHDRLYSIQALDGRCEGLMGEAYTRQLDVASASRAGVGVVRAGPGALEPHSVLRLRTTASRETAEDFADSAKMLPDHVRAHGEIRVEIRPEPPLAPIVADLEVPRDLAAQMRRGDRLASFVQVEQRGGQEVLDHFEHVDATFDPKRRVLSLVLEPRYFTNSRTKSGPYEAVIVIGALRKKRSAVL